MGTSRPSRAKAPIDNSHGFTCDRVRAERSVDAREPPGAGKLAIVLSNQGQERLSLEPNLPFPTRYPAQTETGRDVEEDREVGLEHRGRAHRAQPANRVVHDPPQARSL